MPRNASGTFSLVSGNPVVSGTLIDATWANNTLNDIANEMTDSLSRSGEGGMLAPLRLTDGVQATPGLGFTNEPGSGLYRAGTNEWWSVAGGVQVQQHTSNGAVTRFAAGAVGTPSLSAFGDVNTGLWFPAADTLAASVGGAEGWRLTSAGLGIGTLGTTARGNLDISSGNLAGSQTRSIHLGYSAADFYGFRATNINDAGATFAGTFRLQRGTGSAWVDDFVIDNLGNLGIGTSSPGYKLDVSGTSRFSATVGVGSAVPSASGAGISFPATQSASTDPNTLDDYEEGTFTPTLIGSVTNPTVTYAEQLGSYTKIGNVVHFRVRLVVSAASGGSGDLRVGSMPFTAAGIAPPGISVIQFTSGFVTGPAVAAIPASVAQINLWTNLSGTSIAVSDLTGGGFSKFLNIAGTYFV